MSAFKFTEQQKALIKSEIIHLFENINSDHSDLQSLFNRIEAIVNERTDQETAELRRQVEESAENIREQFVIDLLAELNRIGVDTTTWDGDEGLVGTTAHCIKIAILDAADQSKPDLIVPWEEEQYLIDKENHDTFMRGYYACMTDALGYGIIDQPQWESIRWKYDARLHMDRPNKPGYYRAAND